MTPEERSRTLRAEADEVLELIHLREHCAAIGPVTMAGSYFLDLMMYPDIDMYLPTTTAEAMLAVGAKFVGYDCVKEIVFQKAGPEEGDLAGGLYLKPRIQHGDWGRPWKIDMWSLPSALVERKQRELADLKARMTVEQRRLILNYKHSILTDAGRTPMFSGIFIYRAVVNEGLADFDAITAYLRASGIKL